MDFPFKKVLQKLTPRGLDCLRSAILSSGVPERRSDVSRNLESCSPVQSRHLTDIRSKSLLKSLATHAQEHYPSCSYGVYPTEDDSAVAILLVANRYSPNNFW